MYDGVEYGLGLAALVAAVFVFHALYALYHQRSDTKLKIAGSPPCVLDLDYHRRIRDELERSSARRPGAASLEVKVDGLPHGEQVFALFLRRPLHISGDWPRADLAIVTDDAITVTASFASPYVFARRFEVKSRGSLRVDLIASAGDIDIEADRIACWGMTAAGAVRLRAAETSTTLIAGHPILVTSNGIDPDTLGRTPPVELPPRSMGALTRVEKSLRIAEGTVFEQALACYGTVELGEGCVVAAPMKVYGNLSTGNNVVFAGPITVNGRADLGHSCAFFSDVVIKGSIRAAGPCAFGSPATPPISVAARSILVLDALFANGTLRTTEAPGLVCVATTGAP